MVAKINSHLNGLLTNDEAPAAVLYRRMDLRSRLTLLVRGNIASRWLHFRGEKPSVLRVHTERFAILSLPSSVTVVWADDF